MKRPTLDEMKAQPAMFEGLPPNLKLRPGARPCSALADNGKTCNDCRFAVAIRTEAGTRNIGGITEQIGGRMGQDSKIEWTHHTFSPWRGCTKVSAGCDHCYADKYGTRVIESEAMWKQPLKWNKDAETCKCHFSDRGEGICDACLGVRPRVFCASLADVFEGPETMPEFSWGNVRAARTRLFKLIESTPNLDWLLLTKRPENVMKVLQEAYPTPFGLDVSGANKFIAAWLERVWIGTSVENQKTADERIPELLKIPAKVRFLSMEPLLGPVNLKAWLPSGLGSLVDDMIRGKKVQRTSSTYTIEAFNGINWVIVGGESGPNARPMHPDWVRSIRDQCQAAGVPFFFKQWGEWVALAGQEPGEDFARVHGHSKRKDFCFPINSPNCEQAATMYKVGKQKAGRILDGREWNEFPEVGR